ncbi:SseB family protein [Geobacter grbiciae]|uniref:SseB family protein n=1 Tax=Geobacter grbiciae TaxID=155042 RepID=UPI001C014B88|nr:SseB family protein [Geobacter grbiciae]MBT1074462.1 SseB family protein [Geobacter grbiciae]
MTQLDEALVTLRQDMRDAKNQSKFYDLFLNSTFFVPILDEQSRAEVVEVPQDGQVLPLVIEAEGNDYLMLFDTRERLQAWTQTDAKCVEVPGHVLAATTMPPLHWALNAGTEYSKQFHPEEIAWLRDAVERCNAEAAGRGDSSQGEVI